MEKEKTIIVRPHQFICVICGKKMIKIKKQSGKTYSTYKFRCKCSSKNLRLSVG